jgi:hypothetical protein
MDSDDIGTGFSGSQGQGVTYAFEPSMLNQYLGIAWVINENRTIYLEKRGSKRY